MLRCAHSVDGVFDTLDNPEPDFAEWLTKLGCEESHLVALKENAVSTISALMASEKPDAALKQAGLKLKLRKTVVTALDDLERYAIGALDSPRSMHKASYCPGLTV